MRFHKKFGHDRFSRFDVYWIQTDRQTNKQTPRQAKFIYRFMKDLILNIFPYLCFLQTCKPDKEELIKQLIQPIANMDSYGSHIYKTNHFDGLNKNKIKKLYSGTHKNVKKEDDMIQKSIVYFMFDSNSRLPSQQFYMSDCSQIL